MQREKEKVAAKMREKQAAGMFAYVILCTGMPLIPLFFSRREEGC